MYPFLHPQFWLKEMEAHVFTDEEFKQYISFDNAHRLLAEFAKQYHESKTKDVGNDASEFLSDYFDKINNP